MTLRLRVAAIVEGHGEFECVPILLRRIGQELLGGRIIEVIKPIRRSRGELLQESKLRDTVGLAWKLLNDSPASGEPSLILILIDSERVCPRILGPKLLEIARGVDSRADVACVLAHVMYETWFVAAATSLGKYLAVEPEGPPQDPEGSGYGKSWIEERVKSSKYSETLHQPKMTGLMDLAQCRAVSPSFDKLCREMEKRLNQEGREVGG